jgi:hypothetical protein
MILAWVKGSRGPEAQIWHDRETSHGNHFAVIAELEIEREHWGCTIDELKESYPIPSQREEST